MSAITDLVEAARETYAVLDKFTGDVAIRRIREKVGAAVKAWEAEQARAEAYSVDILNREGQFVAILKGPLHGHLNMTLIETVPCATKPFALTEVLGVVIRCLGGHKERRAAIAACLDRLALERPAEGMGGGSET